MTQTAASLLAQLNAEEREASLRLWHLGFQEDWGLAGDLTSRAIIPDELQGAAVLRARQAGTVAGLPCLPLLQNYLLEHFQQTLQMAFFTNDGPVTAGQSLVRWAGPLALLLAVERVALNLLSHLSGIASLTARFRAAMGDAAAQLCDTRKTTPGYRHLEKYAVRQGGGTNHRLGLFDGVIIKDNHLAALQSHGMLTLAAIVQQARANTPTGTIIEVEIDRLDQLADALAGQPDMILLDNFPLVDMVAAVAQRDAVDPSKSILLEASGGVNLATIAEIARTGVDRISVGALTHSAPALDLALDYESEG